MDFQELTWKDIVAKALSELGGQAHLSEINKTIEGHPKTATNPKNSGVYKLIELKPLQPGPQELDSQDTNVNHDSAQGMLVALGSLYGYETFVPTHDQTVRAFQGRKLGEAVTVKDCSDIFRGPNLSKVREIDVLWFTEDDYGLYPVYAFEVEHSTRVKQGLDRLLKIPARYPTSLFIVAPGAEEEKLFANLISQTPFRSHRDRFVFRSYQDLRGIYDTALKHEVERARFGVVERYKQT
jgi:hypothetical protein